MWAPKINSINNFYGRRKGAFLKGLLQGAGLLKHGARGTAQFARIKTCLSKKVGNFCLSKK